MNLKSITSRYARNLGVLGFLALFMVIMAFRHEEFFNLAQASNTIRIHLLVVKQASLIAIVAAAMTLVIIAGGIDLSVGSVAVLSGCMAAGSMVNGGVPVWLGFLICVLVGAACGAVNGSLAAWGRVTPFIATLGMMSVARGASYLFCDSLGVGTTIFGLPAGARFMSGRVPITDTVFLPIPTLVMAVVFLGMHVLLTRTRLGRYAYAIGTNEEVARLCGVPVNRVKLSVFAICGALSGLAGFIDVGELNSANAQGMMGFELDVIAAVVIGGTSLMGGEGRVFGSLAGALLIAYIRDGLTREGMGVGFGMCVIGSIIVAAVLADNVLRRRMGQGGARG